MSVEAVLWDPPPKSGAQSSNKEGPTPDWQQLLKYFKHFMNIAFIITHSQPLTYFYVILNWFFKWFKIVFLVILR